MSNFVSNILKEYTASWENVYFTDPVTGLKAVVSPPYVMNIAKYVDESILKDISQAVSKYMELQIQNYLYKTSKKFKSDINGFGVSSYSKFTTLKELEEYDWNKNYENSFFTVNADVNVKSGFLLTET